MKKFSVPLKHIINKIFTNKILRRTYFFLFLVCLQNILNTACSSHPSLSKEKQETSSLCSLSFSEKEDLKLLFYDLFADNELGYTLFGDKPMSFCTLNTFSPKISKKDFVFRFSLDNSRPLSRGLAVWKKIKNKINQNNYSLILFEDKRYPNFAILVNKNAFEKELFKNIDLFKKYYGEEVTADLILAEMTAKKNYNELATTHLFNNDALLGIVLGFGRRNAQLFQRREELTYLKTPMTIATPSNGFLCVDEELDYLWSHLHPTIKTDGQLLRVIQVTFVGDTDDPETQSLVQKYEALHLKLTDIFHSDGWPEIVFNRLAS